MSDKLTGKASGVTFNGTALYITKYAPKVTRTLVPTTDSGDYDADSDLLHETQLAVKVSMELTVEGYYRKSQTDNAVIAALYSGAAALPVVLRLDAGSLFGHGNFDLSEFSSEVPLEDKVTWTATLKSNGKFTHGA